MDGDRDSGFGNRGTERMDSATPRGTSPTPKSRTPKPDAPPRANSFEHVSKRFRGGQAAAVNDVSLAVEPGEFVVLLGPSGCGKTTLLKMVNRLYEPSGGRILLDGRPVSEMPTTALRRGIGYVIQQTGLFPHMRVADNVAVVPKLLGWKRDQIRRRVDELLELVGLPPGEFRRRYPAQLSGGQQQRVGLARALAGNPTTLLMDEPFGALDAITRSRLQEELRQIHGRLGQTVLFVTHDIEEAVRLADRIVIMRAGQVVQYDEPLRIVMRPADEFVSDLVGAGDVLRRLSLVPVAAATEPLEGALPDGPTIAETANLRAALALLLEARVERLTVVDDGGMPTGTLNLASIESAGVAPVPEDQEQDVARW
jgi:osmoprotectant transport system ATP-binding protein